MWHQPARFENSWPPFCQIWIIFTYLKLWIASASHNFKWVKIQIEWFGGWKVKSSTGIYNSIPVAQGYWPNVGIILDRCHRWRRNIVTTLSITLALHWKWHNLLSTFAYIAQHIRHNHFHQQQLKPSPCWMNLKTYIVHTCSKSINHFLNYTHFKQLSSQLHAVSK